MAFTGNLKDITFNQLLNLIHLSKQTGVLQVERPTERAWLAFDCGKLACAGYGKDDVDLITLLERDHRLTKNQHRLLRELAGGLKDVELGILLINGDYLTREQILSSLKHNLVEGVRRLSAWAEGAFHFDAHQSAPEGSIPVGLDVADLVVESSKQAHEWEKLQAEIPNLDVGLKFIERPGTNLQKMDLSVEEWRVISYVHPNNSLRKIAQTMQLDEIEIRRLVSGLMRSGIVLPVRMRGAPAQSTPRAFASASREEKRSFVNRLIARLRAI